MTNYEKRLLFRLLAMILYFLIGEKATDNAQRLIMETQTHLQHLEAENK